ncbi:alpha/beta fold hydrolase [Nocardia sp. R7R-8]|uniref:alpha/beta fold hydrolase n=1 Tax=Nocardia sp. R7R-8 TaxID=3459304 RepID=UPI00403D64EB
MTTSDPLTTSYGDHPSQFAERWTPAGDPRPGVVLLLHGGWWRQQHSLTLMTPLARDLADRGHIVWNVEYRRIDAPGAEGGWPTTLEDVHAAIAAILDLEAVDAGSVVAVGHSAGGHLALLAAADLGLGGVVAQAPITDLPACAAAGLGESATPLFMGGLPQAQSSAYDAASPIARLPIGCPQLVAHGTDDVRVPIAHSRRYADRARSVGDEVELLEVPGGDHMFVLDPTHDYWRHTVDWIVDRLPRSVPTGHSHTTTHEGTT